LFFLGVILRKIYGMGCEKLLQIGSVKDEKKGDE